jgi:signal transduction histidine kinase
VRPAPAHPTLGSGEQLGRLDALLERGYGRLGWRLLLVYAGGTWAFGLIAATPLLLLLLRVAQVTAGETLRVVGLFLVVGVASTVLGLWSTTRLLRPIADWFDGGRDPGGAAPAWYAVHRLPLEISVRNASLGAVLGPPCLTACLATVMPIDASLVALELLVFLSGIAMVTAVGTFGLQLTLRPLIRDVAGTLDPPPAARGGTLLRSKLLVAVPALTLFVAISAGLASLDPGTPWSECLRRELLVSGALLIFVGPASLLLAHSTLTPLDDLLRATERLKRGDFVSRVPELSGDEYGALAESFNEAIKGLAEREQLAVANERLLDEVRASRARIIAASDAERRRVESKHHERAPQRLIALALDLQMLWDMADAGGPDEMRAMAGEAVAALQGALEELRELARGLHPSVLATDGLAPAIEQVAALAPVPVEVRVPEQRYSEEVESTAYFVASEALANVAKYAAASQAIVSVERRNGRLVVQIADDGVGGADPQAGSGLAGLVDRVAALDGDLTIESSVGHGTTVRAELPIPSQDAP